MSWADFYRRRDAIDLVLARAARDEAFDDVALDVFGGSDELALALQYKWSQQLRGRVAVALADAERAQDVDQVAAVAAAWRTTALRHPTLRRILDEHVPAGGWSGAGEAFGEAVSAEHRMLALAAGLADAAEPPVEAARIGAAFLALVRTTPDRPNHHTSVVEQLFRRLVASS